MTNSRRLSDDMGADTITVRRGGMRDAGCGMRDAGWRDAGCGWGWGRGMGMRDGDAGWGYGMGMRDGDARLGISDEGSRIDGLRTPDYDYGLCFRKQPR